MNTSRESISHAQVEAMVRTNHHLLPSAKKPPAIIRFVRQKAN